MGNKALRLLQRASSEWQNIVSTSDRISFVAFLEEKLEAASQTGDVKQLRAVFRLAVAALSLPKMRRHVKSFELMAEDAQDRLQMAIQSRVRMLILNCLRDLDLSDQRLMPVIEHLRTFIMQFEKRAEMSVRLACAGKQWSRIKDSLCALDEESLELADAESAELQKKVLRSMQFTVLHSDIIDRVQQSVGPQDVPITLHSSVPEDNVHADAGHLACGSLRPPESQSEDKHAATSRRHRKKQRRMSWDENCKLLELWIQKHNRLPSIGGKPKTDPDNEYLGHWLHHRQPDVKAGRLSADQLYQLQTIPHMTELIHKWQHPSTWEDHLSHLEAWVAEHVALPRKNAQNKEERFLGIWLQNQQHPFAKGTLSDQRRSALQHVPLDFSGISKI